MYGKLALSHKSRAQKVGKPDDNCNVIGSTYYCSFGKFQSATTMVTLDIIYWNQMNHSLSNHHIRYQLTSFCSVVAMVKTQVLDFFHPILMCKH